MTGDTSGTETATLLQHMSLYWVFCEVRFAQYLVLSVLFCSVLFVSVVLLLLAIASSVLRFTASDYTFGIIQLFILPLTYTLIEKHY